MTKTEHLTVRLETIIEALNKVILPINSKERICIICEQITALHCIVGDMKGGVVNG